MGSKWSITWEEKPVQRLKLPLKAKTVDVAAGELSGWLKRFGETGTFEYVWEDVSFRPVAGWFELTYPSGRKGEFAKLLQTSRRVKTVKRGAGRSLKIQLARGGDLEMVLCELANLLPG